MGKLPTLLVYLIILVFLSVDLHSFTPLPRGKRGSSQSKPRSGGTGHLDSRGRETIRSETAPEDQGEMALEASAERGGAF